MESMLDEKPTTYGKKNVSTHRKTKHWKEQRNNNDKKKKYQKTHKPQICAHVYVMCYENAAN